MMKIRTVWLAHVPLLCCVLPVLAGLEDFESFQLGTVDGQVGWIGTEEAQIVNSGIAGFGNRSLTLNASTTLPYPEFRSPDLLAGFGRYSMNIHVGSEGLDTEHRVYFDDNYLSFLPDGQLGMPRVIGQGGVTNTFLVDGNWSPNTVHRLEWVAEQREFQNSTYLTVRLDDQLVFEGGGSYLGSVGITVFGAELPDVTVDNISYEKFFPSPDFNRDGAIDLEDIDQLGWEVLRSSLQFDVPPKFDMNADGEVDQLDIVEWLAAAGEANLPSGNPYLRGDSNLDGIVDTSDFNIWNANKFTPQPWSGGDFNADGVTDVSDFAIWNQFKFQSSADTAAVPEPEGVGLWLGGLLVSLAFFRSRR